MTRYFLSEFVCFLYRISLGNMLACSFEDVADLHFMRQKNDRLAPGHNNDRSWRASVFNGSIAVDIINSNKNISTSVWIISNECLLQHECCTHHIRVNVPKPLCVAFQQRIENAFRRIDNALECFVWSNSALEANQARSHPESPSPDLLDGSLGSDLSHLLNILAIRKCHNFPLNAMRTAFMRSVCWNSAFYLRIEPGTAYISLKKVFVAYKLCMYCSTFCVLLASISFSLGLRSEDDNCSLIFATSSGCIISNQLCPNKSC